MHLAVSPRKAEKELWEKNLLMAMRYPEKLCSTHPMGGIQSKLWDMLCCAAGKPYVAKLDHRQTPLAHQIELGR